MSVKIKQVLFDSTSQARNNIGTGNVVLEQFNSVRVESGQIVELTGNVDFRNAGPLRFYEFLRDGNLVQGFRQFTHQGTDSVITMKAFLIPGASTSRYTLRTRGGSATDDVFYSFFSLKVFDPD